jgi:hypothetical protein
VRKCASERQNKAGNGAKGAGLQEKKPKKGRKMAIRRNYDTAEEIYVYVSVIFLRHRKKGTKGRRKREKYSVNWKGWLSWSVYVSCIFYSGKIAKK